MFHLRFTPYDISGYTFNFLENYDRYILAQEDYDDEGNELLHYHISIDTDYGEKTVRDAAKASLKIPTSGRGKNNAFYALFTDWKDTSYICKYNNILRSKGYTEKEILDYVILGQQRYLQKPKDKNKTTILVIEKKPKETKVPFQQAVLADATADWYNYKRECRENEEVVKKSNIIDFIAKAMVKNGKGINQYLVKELYYAVLHEDMEYRQVVLDKLKSFVDL